MSDTRVYRLSDTRVYEGPVCGATVCQAVCREAGKSDRLRVPREQKMLKGHLPIVIHHQVYWYTKNNVEKDKRGSLGKIKSRK